MPIVEADLEYRYSGGASNADPTASLGGTISSEIIPDATLHNIFDVVTGDEGAAGDIEYRGIYIVNDHGSLTLQGAKLWVVDQPDGDSAIAIALDGGGVDATMETIGNESSAPSGESFSAPSSKGAGLSLGDIAAGEKYGIWIRRTVTASAAAVDDESFTIRVEGDSAQ